jgi:L-rhamnose-H+ transport protein
MDTALGIILVAVGGLIMGGGGWPIKLMRVFQFEHFWFVGFLAGLVITPWAITLIAFPHVFAACRDLPASTLVLSNLLSLVWGVANILCGLCLLRIGFALTQAILAGLGVCVGVSIPMIIKASGSFRDAPDLTSKAGLIVLSGVGVMLIGVILASLAGFGRDRELKKLQQPSGSFLGGLIMCVIAGITSAGLWLAFDYSQGPIVSRVSMIKAGATIKLTVTHDKTLNGEYLVSQDGTISLSDVGPVQIAGMNAKAAAEKVADTLRLPHQPDLNTAVRVETSNFLAVFPVWAMGAFSGILLNLLYPAYLMTKKKSWGVLATSWKEVALSVFMGLETCIAIALPGKGMILLGPFGASVGFGIQQAMQMTGAQGVGFISGEWRGIHGKPRWQMYCAIAALVIASIIMAIGNWST